VADHKAHVTQHAVWTNRSDKPVEQLIFNVHSRFVPPKDRETIIQFAKLLELFRLRLREAFYQATAFNLHKVERLRQVGGRWERDELTTQWHKDVDTALVVVLP
jgi:hypothetical protein